MLSACVASRSERIAAVPGAGRAERFEPGEQLLGVPALATGALDDGDVLRHGGRVPAGCGERVPEAEGGQSSDGCFTDADHIDETVGPMQLVVDGTSGPPETAPRTEPHIG